ncbi:MAG: GNAT family N-acetyltransferase [Candidatus Lernaella stagnicola]|nr:GNAT family N-acetyltransferase [Candidatus Lernaella stagnicola]
MAITRLLTTEDHEAWRALLADTHLGDVYHHPGYLATLAARGEGEPLLFVFESEQGRGLHAVLKRPLADLPFPHAFRDGFDAVSPYGYAGPVLESPAIAEVFWDRWSDAAQQLGIVSEFVRFHPLLANHAACAGLFDITQAGRTIWMDLADDPWQTVSKSRRRDAGYAQRQGVKVESVGLEHLSSFVRLYQETMTRVDATGYYFFDEAYFAALADGLGDDFRLVRAHLDGTDCAYALCLRHGERLHYHLSCTAEAMSHTRAVNLLLIETAVMARDAGLTQFHLGGGYRGEDSLFDFKSHFSPQRSPFFVGRVVHDETAVSALTGKAKAAGVVMNDSSFFPPYRSGR